MESTLNSTLLLDVARRFALLARELAPQLEQRIEPGPPTAQLSQLSRHLGALLEALPAADATHHRCKLSVHLCERLRLRLAPILEANTSVDEANLLDLCLRSEGFRSLFRELEEELLAATGADATADDVSADFHAAVADAIEGAQSGPPSCASSCSDQRDGDLYFGLDDELPPFHELGDSLVQLMGGGGNGDGDGANFPLGSWHRLQRFSACDLLESDQWGDVLPALLRVLLGAREETTMLDCVQLHAALLAEGGPVQRASVFCNLAKFAAEAQPPAAAVGDSGAWTEAVSLLASARAGMHG